jgi:uncharacterized membrane protein YgcG
MASAAEGHGEGLPSAYDDAAFDPEVSTIEILETAEVESAFNAPTMGKLGELMSLAVSWTRFILETYGWHIVLACVVLYVGSIKLDYWLRIRRAYDSSRVEAVESTMASKRAAVLDRWAAEAEGAAVGDEKGITVKRKPLTTEDRRLKRLYGSEEDEKKKQASAAKDDAAWLASKSTSKGKFNPYHKGQGMGGGSGGGGDGGRFRPSGRRGPGGRGGGGGG